MATGNSSQPPPNPSSPPPISQWFNRLGLSGKLLAIGGIVGVVGSFLPLVSVSVEGGGLRLGRTAMVIDAWQGIVCLLGYLASIVFAWLLYPPSAAINKNLCWAALGVGAVVALLALWMIIQAMRASSGFGGFDFGVRVGPGTGAFVNVLAAAAVAAGAALKCREEKLV